uniref:Uncharacterized protein n=1 Tax=Arundo donax TaxID=35708 RepID=A0A0A9CAQ5_ARUDO
MRLGCYGWLYCNMIGSCRNRNK